MTITRNYSATIEAITNCIGKTVLDVARVQYYFNNQESDGFGNLEITFSDNSYLTLMGLGDAESIQADNKKAEIYQTFNVTDNHIASWKRLRLNEDLNWKKIIGQTLKTAEVEWLSYQNVEDKLIACVLYFDIDYFIFYETGSDSNKFYVNQSLPLLNRQKRTEKIV